MPQMMPLNWMILFMFFFLLLIIFNTLNYFLIMYKSPHNKLNKFLPKISNWKW
nr:ATP synthase F0 subunit 8 [Brunneria borealis]